jgi:DedD protein
MKPDIPESDTQLELKKSARRRLIGAIFFVVVAAAVLPMIMDTTPPPQLNDFRIVTAEERNAPPVAATAPAPTEPEPAPTPAPVAQADTKPVDAVPLKAAESAPAAPVVVAAAESAKPEAKPEPKPEPKPEAKPVAEKKPEPAKPVDKPADKKDSKDAKDQAGQYYIQVGVFADADNVKQVRAKLKAQGISSWTEEATGNLAGKTRVKAGPFPSRDAADKALAKITKAGMNGMIAKK